jgi:hypothetical protein
MLKSILVVMTLSLVWPSSEDLSRAGVSNKAETVEMQIPPIPYIASSLDDQESK